MLGIGLYINERQTVPEGGHPMHKRWEVVRHQYTWRAAVRESGRAAARNGDLLGAVLFSVFAFWAAGQERALLPYIRFEVLAVLLSLMLVLGGLRRAGAVEMVCGLLLDRCQTVRGVAGFFTGACFFSSMLITNDASLLIFVPESILLLKRLHQENVVIPVIILETLGANLGSTLLPSGNPQNLYLYFHYQMELSAFLHVTVPITVLSAVMLYMGVRRIPDRFVPSIRSDVYTTSIRAVLLYGALFFMTGAVILRILSLPWLLCPILFSVVYDRHFIREVDWKLLALFVFLFIGVGNLEHLPALSESIRESLAGWELECAILVSQITSNVPAAVLLSGYTGKDTLLVAGTDIGGLGTLIASMASLISFRCYTKMEGHKTWSYLESFTLWNVIFLLVLYGGEKALLAN